MTSIGGILPAPLASDDARVNESRHSSIVTSPPRLQALKREHYGAVLRQTLHASDFATPTRNAHLPFRRGGFDSLCTALNYAAKGATGFNFFDARGRCSTFFNIPG